MRTAGRILWNTKRRKKYDVTHYYFPCFIVSKYALNSFRNFHALGPRPSVVSLQWWIQQQSSVAVRCWILLSLTAVSLYVHFFTTSISRLHMVPVFYACLMSPRKNWNWLLPLIPINTATKQRQGWWHMST